MKDERRKHPRVDIPSKIRYAIPAPFKVAVRSGTRNYDAYAKDISASGMGLETLESIGIGANVTLRFWLLGRDIDLNGEIRYERQAEGGRYHCGVLFKEISDESRDRVGRYILNELAPSSRSMRKAQEEGI